MRAFLPVVAAAALAVAGCGAGEDGAGGVSPDQLYAGNGLVLEEPGRGPILCLGDSTASDPPQCVGVPLAGWDWAAVGGERTTTGTTWGEYGVRGTYDGETFTLVAAGELEPDVESSGGGRDFTPRCPRPEGGWVATDPSRAFEDDFDAGAAVAEARPDYVALWVSYGDLTDEDLERADMEGTPVLETMNVVVSEDPAGAEAAIREVWGGPLCVTRQEGHTEEELTAIREEAERFIEDELGLDSTWSSEGDVGLAAEVGVIVDPGGAGQAALDERYGPGMVLLVPALRPVE